ncbi:MAG: cytidine deaminase [Candidatus Fermentibacter sp.]|nr:cytidine deaminase [Candidatus Fermentibacter sp.]
MTDAMAGAAREATRFCHAPYSGFRVAAVLEDAGGCLHTGVNVENASYGLSICAERAAVVGAVSRGATVFRRILVHSPDGRAVPCGACRQVLAEFCGDDTPVVILLPDGRTEETTLGALLPDAFRLDPPDA